MRLAQKLKRELRMGETNGVPQQAKEIRAEFISSVQAYKEAKKSDKEKESLKHFENALSLKKQYAEIVKKSGKYGTILAKMESNILNIDRGAKPVAEKPAPKKATPAKKPATAKKAAAKSKVTKLVQKKKAPTSDDI